MDSNTNGSGGSALVASYSATAPSNLALIKYMGKLDEKSNQPTNSSFSLLLSGLTSSVRLSVLGPEMQDQWAPMKELGEVQLSENGKTRFLRHLQFMKNQWGITDGILVESGNRFPSDCGLASSASSFAALTKAAYGLFQELRPKEELNEFEIAQLSRHGSGSSCRSFFGPFALWDTGGVRPMEFSLPELLHQVVVVSREKKLVSSSEAHRRVLTSPKFSGRPGRAEHRLSQLLRAFQNSDWQEAYVVTRDEFLDMHELFHSSVPSFSYFQPGTQAVIDFADQQWRAKGEGPLVTMDAGANVHFIWQKDQIDTARIFATQLSTQYAVLGSPEILS